ncbi:MAG: SDR family NAD(P)-dependent oxidoreductase [Bacteroidales bacterium]|nr:SDR family NAD(P)-dependent oxidoreductase [Bacteroidales bacterium]
MNRIALITGATSGIGEATAVKFASEGLNLILTGRRAEILEKLKNELILKYKIEVLALPFDVRINKEVISAFKKLGDKWNKIDILVNNAGLASGLDFIQEGDLEDWDRMIDTNVKGLLYVSRAILPLMIKSGSGHVINIASTAAKEVYEKGNVYCASKHAVDAISKGMRIDLLKEGIKVTSVNPGLVETEFSIVRFHGDKEKAKIPYNGMKPLTGEDVANVIWYAINLPEHVNINDIVLTATSQANSLYVRRDD